MFRSNARTQATTLIAALVLPAIGWAQTVLFELKNRNLLVPEPVNAPVLDAQGAPLPAGSDYLAELWGNAVPESLRPAFHVYTEDRVFAAFTRPGYFASTVSLEVPSDVEGYAWLQVRVWDTRLGSSYESVAARGLGGYGESSLFKARGTWTSPSSLPAPLRGLESFRIRPVIPEPETPLLLAIGLLVLAKRRIGQIRSHTPTG